MPVWPTDDTIAAIATPAQQQLRSVVRISGPQALDCVGAIFRPDSSSASWQSSRTARVWRGVVELGDVLGGVPAQFLAWPTDRSYTRQPSVEVQLPPSTVIAETCLETVCQHGARLANPGEFTLRAFLAGRLDLTQAEAVLGVIDAESKEALEVALAQLAGNLAEPLAAARAELLGVLSHLEAGLDFADEDIEFIAQDELMAAVKRAIASVALVSEQVEQRRETDGPPTVVLYGRPNSGKSSLFNRLCGDDAAIVSDVAGTTRDYLASDVQWHGAACRLIDTAGLDPSDATSADGQRLGQRQWQQAAVRVLCFDSSSPRDEWERKELARADSRRVIVATKSDLDSPSTDFLADCHCCSSVTGDGIERLIEALVEAIQTSTARLHVAPGTAVRSENSLRLANEHLQRAADLVKQQLGEELVSAELRNALDSLGLVAGEVHHEEVLDQVFRQFCIGK